jgi:hypothetical protein
LQSLDVNWDHGGVADMTRHITIIERLPQEGARSAAIGDAAGIGRRERAVRELEARLRNPWRDSKGRDGALEAWG